MEGNRAAIIGGIASFALGAIVGGAGMYVYSKRYFEQKHDMEIKEMALYYANKYEKDGDVNERINKEESIEEKPAREAEVQTEYESISDIYKGKDKQDPPTAYTSFFSDNGSDSSTSGKVKKGRKKKKVDIEIVDQEVWDENPGAFESSFLVYYEADGTLINEETEKIFDDEFDKDEIVKILESENIDGDTIILQSNITKTLYHVTVEQMAYSEVIVDE